MPRIRPGYIQQARAAIEALDLVRRIAGGELREATGKLSLETQLRLAKQNVDRMIGWIEQREEHNV